MTTASEARDPAVGAVDGNGHEPDAAGPEPDYVDDPEDFLPARRQRMGLLTVALLLLLVAALGVFGGVKLQESRAKTTTAAPTFAAGRGTGAGFGGFGQAGTTGTAAAGAQGAGGQGAGGQGTGATVGTVKLVDGDAIYVTTSDGSIVKVKTTPGSTTITRSVSGAAADLQPGQTVVVQGAAGADGTVAATRVDRRRPRWGRTGRCGGLTAHRPSQGRATSGFAHIGGPAAARHWNPALVAQLDRAPGFYPGGWGFESSRGRSWINGPR